jgi:hypothetical protein
MVRQRVRSVDVRPDAQKDFSEHTQRFMKDMVWTGACRSWCENFWNSPNIRNTGLIIHRQ